MINKNLIIIITCSLFLFSFFFNNLFAIEPGEILKDTRQEERARKISKNIRCMVCQNQSIDDSNAPLARDLRLLIRDQIKDGKSEKEIYSFLREKYGDWILYDPPFNKSNYLLWILPYSALIFGGIIILSLVKKRKTKG